MEKTKEHWICSAFIPKYFSQDLQNLPAVREISPVIQPFLHPLLLWGLTQCVGLPASPRGRFVGDLQPHSRYHPEVVSRYPGRCLCLYGIVDPPQGPLGSQCSLCRKYNYVNRTEKRISNITINPMVSFHQFFLLCSWGLAWYAKFGNKFSQ